MTGLLKLFKIFLISSACFFLFSTFTSSATAAEYSWEHLHNFSSRVRDFDSDPFNAEVLYVALQDGLYKSVDGGASWSLMAFGGRNVSAIAVHPQDSSILYAGAQDEEGWGYGLYRFSDGVWSDPLFESGSYVKQIYVERTQPRVIYAAMGSGIHRSYDGGESWAVGTSPPYIYEFDVSVDDFFKLFVAGGRCGFYKSDDGGQTWTGGRSSCFTPGIYDVDVNPFGGSPLFGQALGGPTFPNCLYRWVGEGPSETLRRNCVAEDVVFNPYVRNEIFLAGGNMGGRFVERSSDFGETWSVFEEGLPSAYPGPAVTEFFIHKAVPYLYAVVGYNDLYRAQVGEITVADRPVILVPGMGASFNPSLFFGHGPDNWAWTPGVQVYDGLLESFENAGYVRDRDLFVAFYDWRAPMMESSCQYLKPVIEEAKTLSGSDQVWLVGHSQGGLVSRAYIQGDCYGDDVEKLVTLGTPHMGTTDAYYAWEGIKFRGYGGMSNALVRLFLVVEEFKQKSSKLNILHEMSPSMKEILPVYDFLKRNDTLIAWDSLEEVNGFLPDLNAELPSLLDTTDATTISGDGNETSEVIKVTQRSEAVGDKWVDGQPIELNPIEFGDGDGRVLEASSSIGDAVTKVADGLNHGELVGLADGQKKLFASLGITMEDSKFVESPPFDAILGFFLGSPATILITDSEGSKVGYNLDTGEYINELGADIWGQDQEEKWVVIPNPDSEEYVVQIFPLDGGGAYHLFASYESDQSQGQEETMGEVLGDESDIVTFVLSPINSEQPVHIEDPDGKIALEEIKTQIRELRKTVVSWHLPNSIRRLIFKSLKSIEKDTKKAQKFFKKGNLRKSEAYINFALVKIDIFEDIAGNFYSRGLLTKEQISTTNFYLNGLKESLLSFL